MPKSFQESNENFTFLPKDVFQQNTAGYSTVVPSIHPRTKSERHTPTVAWMKAKFNTKGDKGRQKATKGDKRRQNALSQVGLEHICIYHVSLHINAQ